ncbi:MAG: FKBP-type peptidyl-prolyl cis-trans isomerase [Planctomycetota bacterium]
MPSSALGIVIPFCVVLLLPGVAQSQDGDAAKTSQASATVADPMGYFLGFSVGQSFQQQGFQPSDFTIDGVRQGLADSIGKKQPALSREQLIEMEGKIQALLQQRQSKLQAEQEAKMREAGIVNREKSELFLSQNAVAKGVQTLAQGVQIKVITRGTGASPKVDDTILVHYTGTHIDGSVFDSSVQRDEPMTAQLDQMIPGWKIALPKMKTGGKWKIFIPSELAYGTRGRPPVIEPNEALIFEVELLEIQ